TESLSISENVVRLVFLPRFTSENLSTFDQVTLSGVKDRSVSDSLHTSEALIRLLELPRRTNEALTIAVVSVLRELLGRNTADFLLIQELLEREGGDRLRRTVEFLHIDELATQVRLAGPFIYFLPFPTGNLPVVSTLGGPVAAGMFRCVDELDHDVITVSILAVPLAESNLLGSAAVSQLAAQQAISSLIMQRSDGNLRYVEA